jgi:Flagellar hook-length control protein FliK
MGMLPILAALAEAMVAIVRGPAPGAGNTAAGSFAALLAPGTEAPAPDTAAKDAEPTDDGTAAVDADAESGAESLDLGAVAALLASLAPPPSPPAPAAAAAGQGDAPSAPVVAGDEGKTEGGEPGRGETPGGVVAPTGASANAAAAATGGGGEGVLSAPSPLPSDDELPKASAPAHPARGGHAAAHRAEKAEGAPLPGTDDAAPTSDAPRPSARPAAASVAGEPGEPIATTVSRVARRAADEQRAHAGEERRLEPGAVADAKAARAASHAPLAEPTPIAGAGAADDRESAGDAAVAARTLHHVEPANARESGEFLLHAVRERDAAPVSAPPAPPRADVPVPVPAEEVIERLIHAEALHAARGRDTGEMRLAVSPEGLGHVEVRVVVREDAVHATLWAQEDHTRDALTSQRQALADALGRSQLRLEGFTVGLGGERSPRQETPDAPPVPGAFAPLVPSAPEAPEPLVPLTTVHGLSLRA